MVRAMVQTGTIAGDGGPHQEVVGATVQAQGVLLQALVKDMVLGLEVAQGLDPDLDMDMVVVVLVVVVLGMEVVPAILVVVGIIGHHLCLVVKPTMVRNIVRLIRAS